MIIVVADDITGAAELAGIAHGHGRRTLLTTALADALPDCDVLVVDAGTRSMTRPEAVERTCQLMADLDSMGEGVSLFKKTDSALRGHVMAELRATMESPFLHHIHQDGHVVFLPANPSQGRVIRNGMYFVHGKPIHETDFSFDPEFPALFSSMADRFPEASVLGVSMPDAACVEDVQRVVQEAPQDVLMAGAADLFTAFLENKGFSAVMHPSSFCLEPSEMLVVAGSTQGKAAPWKIPTVSMPLGVYDGEEDVHEWMREASAAYAKHRALMLDIPFHHLTGRDVALRLRNDMAVMVKNLFTLHRPASLVIEGGATASAILDSLGWEHLEVTEVISSGVIHLQEPGGCHVILKPGSYPWVT